MIKKALLILWLQSPQGMQVLTVEVDDDRCALEGLKAKLALVDIGTNRTVTFACVFREGEKTAPVKR
jgi:hypothetical protein